MKKFIKNTVSLAVLLALIYYFRTPLSTKVFPYLNNFWNDLTSLVSDDVPCKKPIPYVLGTFDNSFKISKEYFLSVLSDAEDIWEKSARKELFSYVPEESSGNLLKINLIYDYRQQATEKLKSLGIVVKNTRASYDSLKSKYTALQSEYSNNKISFEERVQIFNQKNKYYEEQVKYWNKRGGAPKKEFDSLETLRQELENESEKLKILQSKINNTVEELNAMAVTLNNLAEILNINAEKYNTVGASRGESFEEGVYYSDASGRGIDIYEFSSREKLVRVLAHELGHALGLEHVDDPKAIMYKLNEGNSSVLSPSDLDLLKTKCGV